MPLLSNGDRFPALAIQAVGGGTISVPDDLAGFYSVVLFYRGAWCPYCNAQLAAFSRAASEKLQKRRTSPGYGFPLVAVKETKSASKTRARTAAAAAPTTACAEG